MELLLDRPAIGPLLTYPELVRADAAALRAHFEGMTCEDQRPLEDRMDELQAEIARYGWYVSNGHELEFELVATKGQQAPDRQEFYSAFVDRICAGLEPRLARGKGDIVDLDSSQSPICVRKYVSGLYILDDDQGPKLMEVITNPSTDWRESNNRYWSVIAMLGEVAAEYGCRVKILATHMSTCISSKGPDGKLLIEDNFEGNGEMLMAMQAIRRALLPFSPYLFKSGQPETYPSKVAHWALHDHRVEGRYPKFPDVGGMADTRPDMLAALAGVHKKLTGALEIDEGQLRDCDEIVIRKAPDPNVEALSWLMLWDRPGRRMVLPQTLPRSLVAAGSGKESAKGLDGIVTRLSGGNQTDFTADGGRLLRTAIGGLKLRPQGLAFVNSSFQNDWDRMLCGAGSAWGKVRRIVPPWQSEEPLGYVGTDSELPHHRR